MKLSLFKPPFRGLLPLVWLYFVLGYVFHPESAIMHGRFVDPDDTMYALQSAELVDGQGWYDRVEHRMDPPAGVPFHFARLMEIPYAATLALFTPLVGRPQAIWLMAALWPPLFLLGLLLIFRRQARFFLPKKWMGLSVFIVLLAQGLLFDFMPGHIDHHGFIALLIELCLGFTLGMLGGRSPKSPSQKSRSLLSEPQIKCAIATGITMSFALSIALEVLPWLLTFSSFIGVWACLKPHRAKAALAYGMALSLSALLLLPTYRSPADLLTLDTSSFSCVYVMLTLGIALCFGAVSVAGKEADMAQRLAKVGIFSAIVGVVFLCAFPQLLQGPYGSVDEQLIDFLLPNIKEAIPLATSFDPLSLFLGFLPWPLLSLSVCIWQIYKRRYRLRQMWCLIALLQTTALLLCVFYEARYVPYAQLFGVLPLTFLLWRVTRRAHPMRVALYVAIALFYPIGSMAFVYDLPALKSILYTMMSYTPDCDVSAAAHALNRPPYDTGEPKLIMNSMNEGPDLLLETRDRVLAASFHENLSGNIDAFNFFRADDPQTAENIVRRRKADFVLVCRNVDRGYVLANPLSMDTALPNPFVKSLITNQIPDWLSPVTLDAPSDVLLFHVEPEKRPSS